MNATPPYYTAAQMATALSRTRQSIARSLADHPADGRAVIGGQPASAWSFAALPVRLQNELEQAAQARGFRNAMALLASPPRIWQPAVLLADVAPSALDKAVKLQRALARVLERQEDATLTSSALEQMGIEDYRREFGHAITDRAIRALVKRTLDRDAGVLNFSRLEIFLPENPARKSSPAPILSLASETEFSRLHAVIGSLPNPANPTANARMEIWIRAFEAYDEKLAEGKAPRKTKVSLLKFLLRHAPFLVSRDATSAAHALRCGFQRRYGKWIASGRQASSQDDFRPQKSGNFRAVDPSLEDKLLLTAGSAKLGGGMEQAWDMLRPQLSTAVQEYYRDSEDCPRAIREEISPDVKLAKNRLHGKTAARTAGAYVDVDPDGTAPGDWDQSDDMTMVNVWWEEAPDSPSGFWFGQGQLLPWIDERSWFIYTWDLISDPYYDAFSIRNSWTVKAHAWGLPRKGLSLERGIWKTASLVVGEKHPELERASALHRGNDVVPLVDTDAGLRRLGLRFAHATHARGKIIERIFGKLQNFFQAAPGYVGRNPLTDRYEEVQKQIRLVKSGKVHPQEFFLHKQQWKQILDKVCLTHNQSPMHGKYHEGLSPAQVYEAKFTSALVKIPDQYRYLLASNKYERPVTGNGIRFKFGKQDFIYKCYEFGALRGQRVVAWFNPENPETVCCTDLQGGKAFIAERGQKVSRHDPQPGTLEKAMAQNAVMARYQKELHSSLKPYYTAAFWQKMFRPCLVDAAAVESAAEFSRQHEARETARDEIKKVETAGRKLSDKLGIRSTPDKLLRPETIPAMEKLGNLLAEDDDTADRNAKDITT